MSLYFKLLNSPVFTVDEVNKFYNNIDSSRSAIKRLMKDGMVAKIRNNMYTCVSGETKSPVANRYQIASKITSSSYVSHHTAMEYYGITDQVYYDVYVASKSSFRDFSFDGYTYRYVASKDTEGVETPALSGGIRITNRERTLIDSVKDMDKIAGIEEVLQNVGSMNHIQEDRLLTYLELFSNQFLYQKIGFILFEHKDRMELSDEFFDICRNHIGKSKRYLTNDISGGRYVNEWRLVAPENINAFKNGVIENATI